MTVYCAGNRPLRCPKRLHAVKVVIDTSGSEIDGIEILRSCAQAPFTMRGSIHVMSVQESRFSSYKSASDFARKCAQASGIATKIHRRDDGMWCVKHDDAADGGAAIKWKSVRIDASEREQIRDYQQELYGEDYNLGGREYQDWSNSGDDMDSSDYEDLMREPPEY